MRYIIFVIDDRTVSASGDEMGAIGAFNDGLKAAGQFIYAEGIGRPEAATVFDNRGGAGLSQTGSVFTSNENYSGFWLIECGSDSKAAEIAAGASAACNRRVEMRPFLSN